MYKLSGLPLTLACTCAYLGLSDPGGVVAESVTRMGGGAFASIGLLGVMLSPTVLARCVRWWKG